MKKLVKNELRREVATWLKITSILVGIILLGLSNTFLEKTKYLLYLKKKGQNREGFYLIIRKKSKTVF